LNPEVAYEWTYGVVWTPAKLIKGLTLSADFYHIDLRNVINGREPNIILLNNFGSSTGTLPNGAPTGGIFSDLIQRGTLRQVIAEVALCEVRCANCHRRITRRREREALALVAESGFEPELPGL